MVILYTGPFAPPLDGLGREHPDSHGRRSFRRARRSSDRGSLREVGSCRAVRRS
jgi:hypothetical protein